MIYNEFDGWCFIHIPKNAGSSVNNASFYGRNKALSNLGNIFPQENHVTRIQSKSDVRHNKWHYWRDEIPKGLRPIAIIRNPWARCVSIYLYNLKLAHRMSDQGWAQEDHPRLSYEGFRNSWMPGGFFVDGHAEEIEYSDSTGRAWSQSDQQISWLSVNGTIVGDFYKLEDEMPELCSRLNIQEMPWVNKTTEFDYEKYYQNDEILINRISELFKDDIKFGKYEFSK
jgi:hypothetical protein